MASWRPAVAGGLAFVVSMAAEVGVLAAIGGEGRLPIMPVLVAPLAEEGAKRLAAQGLSATFGVTGLGFGVIEGLLKLLEWGPGALPGAVASLLQHWAYGRWMERAGFWIALGLHAAFNALSFVPVPSWPWMGLMPPLLAALLLAASFRGKFPSPGGR
ncbi:hypothetical protein [Roseococcus sp. YIM B11640]|uniref:hypothetical protein n=1 Tax=Roseococcus sp. YIM B11640 TaxID=3133973 RepID=UPI003C7BF3AF